jgi:hypothetical protein
MNRGLARYGLLGIALTVVAAGRSEAQRLNTGNSLFAQDRASDTPRLEIDPNPEVAFLTMAFRGGQFGQESVYTFFGDGALKIALFESERHVLLRSWSSFLEPFEMREVLSEIVSGRLMTADPATIAAQAKGRGEKLKGSDEGDMVVVTLSLLSRSARPTDPAVVMSNRFVVEGAALRQGFADEWTSVGRIVARAREWKAQASEEVAQ